MFSDRPPSFVFPDTRSGRDRMRAFVAEEPAVLMGTTRTCDRWEPTAHPVYTDDDLYTDKSIPKCSNRNRSGVRDMNWCCRCDAGFPHTWLDRHDESGLKDRQVALSI